MGLAFSRASFVFVVAFFPVRREVVGFVPACREPRFGLAASLLVLAARTDVVFLVRVAAAGFGFGAFFLAMFDRVGQNDPLQYRAM